MTNSLDPKAVTMALPDGATGWQGDDVTGHIFRAPSNAHGGGLTLLGAWLVNGAAHGAGTAAAVSLENWGTAGNAIKAGAAGTIAAAIGGTADFFAADTPKAFTISLPFIDAGEWIVARKTEENSADFTRGAISLQYVMGK